MPTLTLRESPTVPLEAEGISPDVFAGLTLDAVRSLPVYHGKRTLTVGDFFDITGEPGEQIELHGDLTKVKWIGKGMTRGSVHVHGHAGMHLGAFMAGGRIDVTGNAGDWVGGEMSGGLIHVRGNAGHQIGAAYRGAASGMSGGTILIDGTAGIELGMRMKKGLIAVRGKVRDFAGLQMKGGTIVLMSGAELRTGAWMQRGTIVSLAPLRLLPTFAPACTYSPTFLRLYAKHLATHGFTLPLDGYTRFAGDSAAIGKGELLVRQPG
jgi:formylmethanofuran dehydrogenase subunit C